MLIVCFFLHIKSLPNLLFGVLCLPGDQSHPFAQPTINPLACCICWAGLLGHAVFPPWNEGPNFGSYNGIIQARMLEQAAIPFRRGSFQHRDHDQIRVSHIAGSFFTIWATRETWLQCDALGHITLLCSCLKR